jgi:2-hydroxychromene-2-carboxylate isomerase
VSTPRDPWRFYFDFISPYAFLAWTQIGAIAKRHDRVVEPVPILFAALLDAHGQKGPAEIPAKRRYTFKDVARKAHRFGLPRIELPPAHPFNPLVSLRVASLPLAHDARARIIDALYYAVWTKRQAIDAADAVIAVLGGAGFDGAPLVESAQTPEAKLRVRTATDAAIAQGVFGVPTVIADGEMFWGSDALADLDLFAAGKGPDLTDATRADPPIGATRKARDE